MQLTARHSLLIILVSFAVLGGVTAMFVFQPESELRDCVNAPAGKQGKFPATFEEAEAYADSLFNTNTRKGVLVDRVS